MHWVAIFFCSSYLLASLMLHNQPWAYLLLRTSFTGSWVGKASRSQDRTWENRRVLSMPVIKHQLCWSASVIFSVSMGFPKARPAVRYPTGSKRRVFEFKSTAMGWFQPRVDFDTLWNVDCLRGVHIYNYIYLAWVHPADGLIQAQHVPIHVQQQHIHIHIHSYVCTYVERNRDRWRFLSACCLTFLKPRLTMF